MECAPGGAVCASAEVLCLDIWCVVVEFLAVADVVAVAGVCRTCRDAAHYRCLEVQARDVWTERRLEGLAKLGAWPRLSVRWWFQPSPNIAQSKLVLEGDSRDGAFLVRPSTTYSDRYTISFRRGGLIRHVRIQRQREYPQLYYLEQGAMFESVPKLVAFYATNKLETPDRFLRRFDGLAPFQLAFGCGIQGFPDEDPIYDYICQDSDTSYGEVQVEPRERAALPATAAPTASSTAATATAVEPGHQYVDGDEEEEDLREGQRVVCRGGAGGAEPEATGRRAEKRQGAPASVEVGSPTRHLKWHLLKKRKHSHRRSLTLSAGSATTTTSTL